MNDTLAETLSSHFGRQLFYYLIKHSDIYHIANRCANFVTKIHEPLERGVAILDNLLTLEEEDIFTCDTFNSMENAHHENQQIILNNNNYAERGKLI